MIKKSSKKISVNFIDYQVETMTFQTNSLTLLPQQNTEFK
jgi:hypothetical protein